MHSYTYRKHALKLPPGAVRAALSHNKTEKNAGANENSTIYSTLRRREPNGCDEKELVGRVFHSSMSASAERRGGGGDANAGTPAGVSVAGGGGGGNTGDAPESHRFSKTKVRGAVTLLKFAQVCAHDFCFFLIHH